MFLKIFHYLLALLNYPLLALRRWAKREPFLARITFIVAAAHVLLIFYAAMYEAFSTPPKKIPEKFVVKTVQIKEHPLSVATSKPPPPQLPNEVAIAEVVESQPLPLKEEPLPEPKKVEIETPPPVIEKIPTPKPEPAPKIEKPPVKEEPPPPPPKPAKTTPPKQTKPEKKQPPSKPSKPAAVKKAVPKEKENKPEKKPVAAKPAPQEKSVKEKEAQAKAAKQKEIEAQAKAAKEKAEKEKAQQEAAALAKKRELLSSAKNKIAKIDKSHDNFTSSQAVKSPGQIAALSVETYGADTSTLSPLEMSYTDELVHRLKLLLRLPEYGEVKIKLTLQRTGKVSKVVITSAESAVNRKYIEKTLPTLTFPPFGKNFEKEQEHTFTIVLSNDL